MVDRFLLRTLRAQLTLFISALLVSCSNSPLHVQRPTPPQFMEQGVSVNGDIVYIRPWSDVVGSLSPHFDNSGANALSQVLQNQSFADFRLMNALGLTLNAGMQFGPRSTSSDQSTENVALTTAGGTTTTTQDQTNRTITTGTTTTNASPDAAPSPGSAAGARTAQGLPDLVGTNPTPGAEPFFHYAAAASLFQEIALINDAVNGIPQYRGRVPYIIRVRIGVTTFQHYLPWDVYGHLHLFHRSRGSENIESPIIILPILSTEAYEATLDASALEQLADLRLGLQAAIANARLGADASSLHDNLTQFLTRHFRSSMRISGASGDSIEIKFSAAEDSNGSSLEERDHYVTLIAYLDPDHDPVEPSTNSIRYEFMFTHDARNSDSGLPVPTNGLILERELDILANSLRISTLSVHPNGRCGSSWPTTLFYAADEIRDMGPQHAFQSIENCLDNPEEFRRIIGPSRDFFISRLLEVASHNISSSMVFFVERTTPSWMEATPQVEVSADETIVWMPYFGRLDLNQFYPAIISAGDAPQTLLPRNMTTSTAGGNSFAVLHFPPLPIAQPSAGETAAARTAQIRAELAHWSLCRPERGDEATLCVRDDSHRQARLVSLANSYLHPPPNTALPPFEMSSSIQSVRPDASGNLTFGIYVKPGAGETIDISAQGAELLESGNPVRFIQITGSDVVRQVTLRNATPGGTVTLLATVHGEEHAPVQRITVSVQPGSSSVSSH